MFRTKITYITLIIFTALIFFAAGWYGHAQKTNKELLESQSSIIRENSPQYHYINPLILSNDAKLYSPEFEGLRTQINKYVSDAQTQGNAQNISVYFRDLNTAHWTGVNEDDKYAPSSMLKATILLGYLKAVENDPNILREQYNYSPIKDPGQYYEPHFLPAGKYSVADLLKQLIIESDNNAMHILDEAHVIEVLNVYKELKLPDPLSSEENFMSAQDYSKVFRALFNATYLTKEDSEQALKLLSLTTFNRGLTKGTSPSTVVAHKFGEHTRVVDGKVVEHELHDCGIVYFPTRPYFLCVMTRGQDFGALEKVIGAISKIVFDYTGQTKD